MTKVRTFVREHQLLTGFLIAILVLGVPLILMANASYQQGQDLDSTQGDLTDAQEALEFQAEGFIDYQVNTAFKGCNSSNNSRSAIQAVLDGAANPPPGVADVDFSELDGYDELAPDIQFFLNSLQARLSEPGGSAYLSELAANYRDTNPSDVDCDEVAAELRSKLETKDTDPDD